LDSLFDPAHLQGWTTRHPDKRTIAQDLAWFLTQKSQKRNPSSIIRNMKKILYLVLLLLLGATSSMNAQGVPASPKRFAIKINPLSIFLLTGNVQAEAAISNKVSLQLGFFYTNLKIGSNAASADGKVGYNLMGITPELRFYVLNEESAPRGLYVAPFARVRTGNIFANGFVNDPDTGDDLYANLEAKLLAIGGGCTVGYQLVTAGGFVFDAFIGPQFSVANLTLSAECAGCNGNEVLPTKIGTTFGGPGLRLGMAIGYAF
jgi:hypothetical protein